MKKEGNQAKFWERKIGGRERGKVWESKNLEKDGRKKRL